MRMYTYARLKGELTGGRWDSRLDRIYCCGGDGEKIQLSKARALGALDRFADLYGTGDDSPVVLFSSPGRTEIGGNHTDHQHGCVLAASVDMDMLAAAAPNGGPLVRIHSEGFAPFTVDIGDLFPRREEENTSRSLIRGVAAGIARRGYPVSGFDAYITSSIPPGSGLSSSAAFEVLIGNILNALCCGGALDPVELAKIGQYAENTFFGKPCGLMDQMASSVGGVVAIDFKIPDAPAIRRIGCDFAASGHSLCIIDSGADHADLTGEYAAIAGEMRAVAEQLGQTVLRDVDETRFRGAVPELRERLGDRAVLRAMHFFADTRRARDEASALESGDFPLFLRLVGESGRSSGLYLQNLSVWSRPREQAVTLALALAEAGLRGRGAVRVHGGGFAGTLQAFVPAESRAQFKRELEAVLGPGHCHYVEIRPEGGCVLIGR